MKRTFLFFGLISLVTMEKIEANFMVSDSLSNKKDSIALISTDSVTIQKPDSIVLQKKDSTEKDTATTVKKEVLPIKEEESAKYDTIFKKSEFAIVCKVLDKNLYEIKYIKKGEKLERKISTREIKSINYASGKIDLIDNNPMKNKKDWITQTSEVEWKRIKVVKSEEEVSGMIDKGDLEAEYEAAKIMMGNDVLERNAIAILQKKAFALKANAILILTKDIKREYGEIPSIRITAKAYSKE